MPAEDWFEQNAPRKTQLTQDQAIESLRKLPEAKQREVLKRLTPEARKGLLAKLNGEAERNNLLVSQWMSFDQPRRKRLLERMTPEQKKKLRSSIEASSSINPNGIDDPWAVVSAQPANSDSDPWGVVSVVPADQGAGSNEPTQYGEIKPFTPTIASRIEDAEHHLREMMNIPDTPVHDAPLGSPGEIIESPLLGPLRAAHGLTQLAKHPVAAINEIIGGLGQTVALPAAVVNPGFLAAAAPGAVVQSGIQSGLEKAGVNPDMAQLASTAATIAGAEGMARTPGMLKQRFIEKFRPRVVTLEGEKVPVLVGEASPDSRVGRLQANVKRSGVSGAKFDRVTQVQQDAVKKIIRNVAQKTSGLTGPMPAEPGMAVRSAADATFAQARPMYAALDTSLVKVPDTLAEASHVTQNAIARAHKLGAVFGDEVTGGHYVDRSGNVVDRRDMSPLRFDQALQRGDIVLRKAQAVQPLQTYMRVRSELLKMQRSSSDAATRNAIGDEVRRMNENMEAALKGSPLSNNWTEANRIWAKGYALRDVADAITKATKGTPAAEQAAGIDRVQTRIKGTQLVNRLNELQRNGILERAFSPDEARHLRQAADILDRASASAGKSGVLQHGYSPRSVFFRHLLNAPAIPLVRAMTTIEGLKALEEGAKASSREQAQRAAARLIAISSGSAYPKTPAEAKKMVARMAFAQ
ncbi:MAG TPA: hypothetical protein VFE38_00050 [Edaphobacter sp.]|nr:hypothetical protein [Edaphobacter sp.]